MKKIVLLILSFIIFLNISYGQIINNVIQTFRNGIWVADHYLGVDSAMLFNPVDTTFKPIYPGLLYRDADSSFYYWNGSLWKGLNNSILNQKSLQSNANFNISGNGQIGDSLTIGTPTFIGNELTAIGGAYPQFLIGNQTPQTASGGNYFRTSIANDGGVLLTVDTNVNATDYGQYGMLIINKRGYINDSYSAMGMRAGSAGGSREMEVDVGYDMIDHTTDDGYSIFRIYGINSSQGPSLEDALMGDSVAFTYGFHNYTNGMIWNPYRSDDYFLHLITGSILLDAGNISTQGILTNIRVITGNYTVVSMDRTIIDNAASAATITLLTAAIAHNQEFKIVNPSANVATLSIAVNALAGGTTTTVSAHTSMTIQSDGTNYWQTN